MSVATDVTIIGAGPYGLSIAAYLRGHGIDCRIVGSPMHTWRTHMPKGMFLKSAGLSATMFDPEGLFSLKQYCQAHDIPYQDEGLPISLELFAQYGMAFQKHFAPDIEEAKVTSLAHCTEGFELKLDNEVSFKSRKVVMAVGIDYFRHLPKPLSALPRELYSHSAEHYTLDKFNGQEVIVIGSGSSAIDMAVLLHEAKAKVHLIARRGELSFGTEEGDSRTWLDRLIAPMSGLGPGWKNLLCADAPWLFRYLPDNFRLRTVKEFLGPSGGWFIKNRLKPVPVILGHLLQQAYVDNGRPHLRFISKDGKERILSADHVIAATGYKPDLQRIEFLHHDLLGEINMICKTPRLNAHFESSVPGLYFAGPATANTFGPVMRFAIGAGFAARQITKHVLRNSERAPVLRPANDNAVQKEPAAVRSQYQR
ncbi:MAG TPA: NAD(P)-binding domain-containing protein [Methylophilaceae bacterium]|nr:NAD(P)-binding domain-containing protein [Methylophilaceae bacterium]